jgi:hypothetical protein
MLVIRYESLRKEKIRCIRYNFLLFPETIEEENYKEAYFKVAAVGVNTKHLGILLEKFADKPFPKY